MQITRPQLARLQVLYNQLAAHETGVGRDRDSRLAWASQRLHKPVSSFKNLTADDAGFLIDNLQGYLQVKAPLKRRLDRDRARRAGLDGRKDGQEFAEAPQIVSAQDIARIQKLCEQLGWSSENFRAYLEGSRSPFCHRADKTVRTSADANKVWWGLKAIAKRKGVWKAKRP